MNDLRDLVIIEHICFPIEEAATEEAFKQRIQLIPDSFLWRKSAVSLLV